MSRVRQIPTILRNPDAVEVVLTVLAILLVSWLMLPFRDSVADGDGRFAVSRISEVQLPNPLMRAVCEGYGLTAASETADACGRYDVKYELGNKLAVSSEIPVLLEQYVVDVTKRFAEPILEVDHKIQALEQQQRQGLTPDQDEFKEKIDSLRSEINPYLTAYSLERNFRGGPSPLQCIGKVVAGAWSTSPDETTKASLAVWYSVRLDGHSDPVAMSDSAYLALNSAWQARDAKGVCYGQASLDDAATALARVMNTARAKAAEAPKAEAMRHLLQNVWWQWPLWLLSGLFFVLIFRRSVPSDCVLQTGVFLFYWSGLGWLCRVWLPFSDDVNKAWSTPSLGAPVALPPMPLLEMMLAGVVIFGIALVRRINSPPVVDPRSALVRQITSSRIAFAGLALLAGVGWVLLLDLSSSGHVRNRYIGLRQQGYLWSAIALVVIATLWRQRIAYFLVRSFGLFGGILSSWRNNKLKAILLFFGAVVVLSLAFSGNRQVTSEVGRIWLIFGAAWYFHVIGDLAIQMVGKTRWSGFFGFLSPLLIVIGVLFLSMGLTNDMGPLLISVYGGGFFVAAAIVYFFQRKDTGWLAARVLGAGVLIVWIFVVTEALFAMGSIHPTSASRIESVYLPFVSSNDQIGIVTWFRQSTPFFGYGVGNTPWCGHAAADVCRGVPLQIHSDYTFTALWGQFGRIGAGFFASFCFYWLYHLIRHHARVTSGMPTSKRLNGTYVLDTQALLSWVCVCWLILTVCQLAVTVAGNLGVLPLTGVTFPFVSYGKTSLWINAIFLGLAMTIDAPRRQTS